MTNLNLRLIPNTITVLRTLLIIPLAYLLAIERYQLAFYFFLIAGFSDAIDGYLARQFAWTSRFGAIADPAADKLLMLVSFISLAYKHFLPWWLFVLAVGRDLWIIAGAIAYRLIISNYDFVPTQISKINTFFQILLITVFLFDAAFQAIPNIIKELLIYLVTITTIASLIDYTWVWGRKALSEARLKKHE